MSVDSAARDRLREPDTGKSGVERPLAPAGQARQSLNGRPGPPRRSLNGRPGPAPSEPERPASPVRARTRAPTYLFSHVAGDDAGGWRGSGGRCSLAEDLEWGAQ